MSDEIVRQMSKYGDYDEETSWSLYKTSYLMKPAAERAADLQKADQWIDHYTSEHTGVTKELASLLTRRRELETLHKTLRGAGR